MNEKWNASEHVLAHLLRRDSACGLSIHGASMTRGIESHVGRRTPAPTVIRRRDPDGMGAVGACETVGSGAVTDAGRDGEEREGTEASSSAPPPSWKQRRRLSTSALHYKRAVYHGVGKHSEPICRSYCQLVECTIIGHPQYVPRDRSSTPPCRQQGMRQIHPSLIGTTTYTTRVQFKSSEGRRGWRGSPCG